jgi:uncharacterized 2Fe-2S/4Fe-4S cluster protein (DUF4445 family)
VDVGTTTVSVQLVYLPRGEAIASRTDYNDQVVCGLDVISRINGLEINSPDKALEMYGRLKDAGSLDIELERRGQPIKKHYAIE